jgi:hypothetical protein
VTVAATGVGSRAVNVRVVGGGRRRSPCAPGRRWTAHRRQPGRELERAHGRRHCREGRFRHAHVCCGRPFLARRDWIGAHPLHGQGERDCGGAGRGELCSHGRGHEARDRRSPPGARGHADGRSSRLEPWNQPGQLLAERSRNNQDALSGLRDAADLRNHAPTGAREQRIDRRSRQAHRRGDLLVREPAELPQDERLALAWRKTGNGARDLREISPIRNDVGWIEEGADSEVVDRDRVTRTPGATALVSGDRRQPGCRVAWPRAAEEASVRAEEGLLRRILSGVRIAQETPADGKHHLRVLVEECRDTRMRRRARPCAETPGDDAHRLGRRDRHAAFRFLRGAIRAGFTAAQSRGSGRVLRLRTAIAVRNLRATRAA